MQWETEREQTPVPALTHHQAVPNERLLQQHLAPAPPATERVEFNKLIAEEGEGSRTIQQR